MRTMRKIGSSKDKHWCFFDDVLGGREQFGVGLGWPNEGARTGCCITLLNSFAEAFPFLTSEHWQLRAWIRNYPNSHCFFPSLTIKWVILFLPVSLCTIDAFEFHSAGNKLLSVKSVQVDFHRSLYFDPVWYLRFPTCLPSSNERSGKFHEVIHRISWRHLRTKITAVGSNMCMLR